MKLYSIYHEKKGLIQYRDKKRTLACICFLSATSSIFYIFVSEDRSRSSFCCSSFSELFAIIPILDWMIGSDSSNPPEEIVPLLEEDKYYRYFNISNCSHAFHSLDCMCMACWDPYAIIYCYFLIAIMAGGYSGIGINTAHELGHKNTWIEQLLAKIVLAVPAYGHFTVEHNSDIT